MLDKLAKMLGLSRDTAEASMYSERAARYVLNRREAIGLGAAMAAGSLFKFATPDPFDGYEFRIRAYGNLVCGIPGWIPIVGVDADDFFGVDRTVLTVTEVDRYAGIITVSSDL